ncbi:MAG: hypothetical protein ACRC1R_05600 [Cetobacterium sp.]|uniref:hypothetical protein n=1 Tax=Cetobacterium sp. TaxID=2071632 RepID=UPI003F2CFB09
MKKILLGLFILSSLSFAELPDGKANRTLDVNVKATIEGKLSLVITDTSDVVLNSLDYDHGLLPNNTTGNVATKSFQVHISDGTNKQLITDNKLLEIATPSPLDISNGISTIKTTFSEPAMEGSTGTYTMSNTLPAPPTGSLYDSGVYSGTTNLTITYNKTTTPTPGQ